MKAGQSLSGAIAGSAFLATALAMPAAAADEMPFPDTGLPLEYVKYVELVRKGLGSDEAARSVHRAAQVWPPSYKRLRVCFFGGTQEARSIVAKAARDWERPENSVKFDFGKSGKYRSCRPGNKIEMQIRVAFNRKGWNSALGTDSVIAVPQEDSSMNLAGYDQLTPDTPYLEYFVGTIRHEFGHALALEHEHQSPNAPCADEYNWDKVYEGLGGPPDNWPKEVIDFNMQPSKPGEVTALEFDAASVMLYRFRPEFYKAGEKAKCYRPDQNKRISEGDRAGIAVMYPADPKARAERFEKAKAAFSALWNEHGAREERSASFDPVKDYFERTGNNDEQDEIPDEE